MREVIRAGGHREEFRVVEFNLLANHLHLLIEAAGQAALSRGMQGLAVRLARRINAEFDRRGRLFAQRYHARTLRTPKEVRAVLRYILLNARHHAHDAGVKLARGWLDPFSSAPWFEGWRATPRVDASWLGALMRELLSDGEAANVARSAKFATIASVGDRRDRRRRGAGQGAGGSQRAAPSTIFSRRAGFSV